jgi:hypothetical protein
MSPDLNPCSARRMREMDEKKFKNGEDKAKAFVVVARMAYYVPGIS